MVSKNNLIKMCVISLAFVLVLSCFNIFFISKESYANTTSNTLYDNTQIQKSTGTGMDAYNTCIVNNMAKGYSDSFKAMIAAGFYKHGVPRTWAQFLSKAKAFGRFLGDANPVGFAWALYTAHNECKGYMGSAPISSQNGVNNNTFDNLQYNRNNY